jgi:ribose 5-phosphate isomerase B
VTPLARDRAAAAGIRFVSDSGRNGRRQCPPRQSRPALDQIAYFTAKPALTIERILRTEIESTGAEIDVCPATRRVEEELDGALSCAGRVSEGSIQRAIVLAEDVYLVQRHANRLPGVRARVCWDAQGALESRRCDDANVLLVSGRLLGQTMVRRIVQAWLSE